MLLILACVPAPPAPPGAPAPSAPREAPKRIADLSALGRAVEGPLERGSCRKGALRVDGFVVLDAQDPAQQDLLIRSLEEQPLEVAAVAVGMLWDIRATLPGSAAQPLARTLAALHKADAHSLDALRCRTLKSVQPDGMLWTVRGDALGLLARVENPHAARTALDLAIDEVPELSAAGRTALGDPGAFHEVSKQSIRELCDGRTWHTTWLMRSLDINRPGGSLLPLGQLQTGACAMLAKGVDPNVVTPRQ